MRALPTPPQRQRAHRAVRALQRCRRAVRGARRAGRGAAGLAGRHAGVSRLDALRAMFVLYARARRGRAVAVPPRCRRPRDGRARGAGGAARRRRAASCCGWRRCSASMPSPAAWSCNSLLALWLFAALRAVAGAGRRVLLLDRPARRGVAAGRAVGGAAHRAAEHDGVHAHPGQPVPDRWPRWRPTLPLALGAAVRAQRAVADGRADAHAPT